MFRRARLSVKPNVRPGVGSRGSTAPNPQRGPETSRPPEPSVASAPKPAESTDVPPVDFGGAEPQEKTPGNSFNSDKRTDDESDVEESSKSSTTVSQRKKRVSSTSNSVKPNVSIPSEPHPLPTVNQEAIQPNSIPPKEKQPCSDRYRIYKAQKLREMLKEELRKEKKQWKNKYVINESQRPPDRTKMTMRDFIYYLPDNNPMTSSLEQEKKTEKSLPPVQTREQENKSTPDAEDNEEIEEETDDGPLLVPRVKVAEDGSIILDEESLTVEVLRTKGPCVVEENDPIFERGSTTTYSSFRKNYYSKPWSNKETDMFFLAISMVGTDFSMIGQLFPHRARIEIKNKFKREEKTNGWRIDKAFQEKRPFDFDFFAHLLQKVLAEEEKRKQKSIKNQNVLKKSSKPRKNVKVKKIASEGVTDDPDESMSTKISDTEGSLKDVQTVNHSVVEEEQQALTLSEQNLEQIVSEPDLNQKKKRKKSQEEAGIQEVKNLSGSATVQSGPSKGEKQKNKCHSLKPEIDEGEGNKEQMLSCPQNIDDVVGFSCDEKVEKRIDPILSSSNQQDAMSVGSETLESSISDLPSSEVGVHALCLVNNAEINSTEERNFDLSKKLETDQIENVKPMVRGRFQRPKPNLSRAVGKKSVLSQGKADEESKSLHPETSVEKDNMEKDKMNTFDISGMENAEKENPEAETVSNLSEKTGLQADEQPKTLRPARLMRGRLQRPKPNISKAAERKETLASQEKNGANVQKNENESCIDKDIPEQMEDQSCKNFECEEVTSQSEQIQPDEPTVLNESLSIQEDNNADILKHVPIVKTQFQKPKPNVGKGIGRKEMFCREEVPEETLASEEMTISLREIAKLEISTREKVSVEGDTIKEMESDLKETGRSDTSPRKKIPEMIEVAVEMETDFKESGKEISPGKKIPEVTIVSEGKKTDLEETGKGEISLQENAPEEVTTVGEVQTGLKETGKENSLREKVLVGISALGEREIHLKETEKAGVSLMETGSGTVTAIEQTEAYLKKTGGEVSLRKNRSEEISATEEMVADLENTGKIDVSLRKNEPEQTDTSRQTETDLIQTSSGDCSTVPSRNVKHASSEVLPMVHTPVEETTYVEKEVSSPSHHSFQTSELDKVEEQGMRPPDIIQQCPDTNSSKPLPQEQKPFEVKTVPFVRSRFKKPKPNLARAALKRETMEADKYGPGKKLETDKMEAVVIQQNSENTNTLPSQQDVTSLMTSTEKDKSGPRQEEAVMLPCIQTQKDLSSSCEVTEESKSTEAQEKESVVSVRTQNINTSQQEEKGSVTQTAPPIRGRLQRPRPNIRRAGQRQRVEKGEAKVITRDEKTQKEENKKFLAVANSAVGTEIEVVSAKVSECSMNDILDEKTRHEHKTHTPSPTQLKRKQFQKAKLNLGKAHGKKEEPCLQKDRADQSEARKPEDNLLQHRDCDIQLLQKEKAELLTSLEVSVRRDCVDSKEAGMAKRSAQSDVGPSGSVGEKSIGNSTLSSVVEEQCLRKLTSSSQLLKESNYPKIVLDRRSTVASASESELDRSERRMHRKIKPNVTKGRGSKRIRSKTVRKEPRTSKAMLVTLRASQEEDEDDTEDFELDYEEENYHLAPEELNKAPVFVPVGLRSPEPVPSQIEETMEELEITVNVPDTGCIAVVEHQLSNTEVTTEEMKQEENVNALSVEMTTGEHTPDEAGMNDGSTEAAITLLTMGDLVLQSEINTEQSDDNVNYKIVHECQLSSTIDSISLASLDEDKIILEEQSTKEKIDLMEKVKENTLPNRGATSEVTNLLNLNTILGTNSLGAHQEVPNLFVTNGEIVVTERETEKNASNATELEDKNIGSVITLESKEQRELACVHGIEETSISQGASLTERHEDQEGSQVHILSVAPVVSSDPTRAHTLDMVNGLAESTIEEHLGRDSSGDSVLTLHVPECTPTSIPEVQQENVVGSQDLTVNLVADVHEEGEDDHTFILTLVEIPTSAVEEFTDTTTQLMPNSLLPAPILVKSVNTEERSDMSMSFPVTVAGQDAMCLSNSGRDDSEKPPTDLDLISRKRFRCRLNESENVPPAKKSSFASRDNCQKYTSEVCSKELNVFEKTGESYKEQDTFPVTGSIHITPEPQKEQLEPSAFQSVGSTSVDKIIDTRVEKNTPQLPQDEMIVSDKNERTCSAAEQMDSRTSSSKTPLSRPGRRPLGFLSLICSKNTLESNEPTQVHIKKRLKPLIPVSRQNLKRSNPLNESQKKPQDSSDMLPSPSVVTNTQSESESENITSSTTQVSSDHHPLLNEECKSDQNRASREEPTTISEYFFNDIFIEVDETE